MENVVIGKRIPLGAAIGSVATVLSLVYPDQAPAIIAASVPVTAALQVIWVNRYGVTTK